MAAVGRQLIRTALAVMAVAVVATACGSGSSTASAADQSYLQSLHLAQPDIGSYRTDVQLARLGHAVCDDFAGGTSYQQLADRLLTLEGSRPMPSEDLGAVIDSAVNTLCPQYRSRVS
jgi:hypothetical protein